MKRWRKKLRNERGSQLIEFMAVFPMILMAMLLIWQMALVAYTVVVAEAAARDGARVAAVHGDYATAVERSAFGLDVDSDSYESSGSSGDAVTVTVTATVPTIKIPIIGQFDYDLTADATMPLEEEEN